MPACIGITTSYEEAQQRLDYSYVRAIESAGGMPVILPMLKDKTVLEALVSRLDGLLIPGGPAITRGLVGLIPPDLPATDPMRLASDFAVLDGCLRRGLPVLGICYGMQLINAYAGGSIYGDVQAQLAGAGAHSEKRGAQNHALQIMADTQLSRILGTAELCVNTYHLQAVAEPGDGLMAAARAPDGVVEAIENRGGSVIGVQFHPERMGSAMRPLFQHLIRCAEDRS